MSGRQSVQESLPQPGPRTRKGAEIGEGRSRSKPRTEKRMHLFTLCLAIIVAGYLAGLAVAVIPGLDYYFTPVTDRAFHSDHQAFKPSGDMGHTLGAVGGVMMLLTFLYPIRKKWRYLQRFGDQKQWLQAHIFLGLGGPGLVLFHTTGKLNGLAAIGFYATLAMVLSGIFGRYLYSKIPRTRRGNEMSLSQIEEQLAALVDELSGNSSQGQLLETVEEFLAQVRRRRLGLVRTLAAALWDDVKSPIRVVEAWKISSLQERGGYRLRLKIARLVLKQRRLIKKLAVLEAIQRLFSYWHVFHRPFTILASVVIGFHVAIATYLGYGVNW